MSKNKLPGKLFSFFILLMVAGLIAFLTTLSDYYTYTSQAAENTASIAALNKESLLALAQKKPQPYDTEIKYRKFFITAPGATRVELQADFNRWGQDPIVLKPYRKGYFDTSVALTAGEYKYVFVVDGKDVLDPLNKDRQILGGREVCIKTVK